MRSPVLKLMTFTVLPLVPPHWLGVTTPALVLQAAVGPSPAHTSVVPSLSSVSTPLGPDELLFPVKPRKPGAGLN